MELRKFLMDELKKASATLQKYEDALLTAADPAGDKEFLKSSVQYYREQCVDLRKQIFETRVDLK